MPGDEGAARLDVAIENKFFGATPVLGRIVFSAQAGAVIALLAPSGMGKTTALRIVLGLDKEFSGTVAVPPGRLAAVFQEPRLLPWMDIAGNMRLVAPDLTDADIARLLGAVDLAGAGALLPRQISLGMARRVSLARALAVRPRLLVLDEPFASLDARLAGRLVLMVADQARAFGAITLMATHDLDQALVVADRVLVLAGKPATLAEDAAVPAPGAHASFAAGLRVRFPFLAVA